MYVHVQHAALCIMMISNKRCLWLLLQMYLRELLHVLLPHFYRHLEKVQDGLELLFCHR